jgi:hypothetical protein
MGACVSSHGVDAIDIARANLMFRIACFFEEVTAHSLQRNMLTGTTLTEIPLSSRVSEAPERFQITVSEGGHVPWRITPHLQLFDDV